MIALNNRRKILKSKSNSLPKQIMKLILNKKELKKVIKKISRDIDEKKLKLLI